MAEIEFLKNPHLFENENIHNDSYYAEAEEFVVNDDYKNNERAVGYRDLKI